MPTTLTITTNSPFEGNLFAGVFGRVFMPVSAMRSSGHHCGASSNSKFQAFKILFFNRIKNFRRRQPLGKSLINCIVMNASLFRPLGSSQRFAIVGNFDVAKSIVRLLFSSGPTTILWAIWAIVINALQSHVWRPISHVCHKVVKNQPSFANGNAAPTISVKMSRFGVKAPLFDVLPAPINWAARFAMFLFHGATVLHWKRKVK